MPREDKLSGRRKAAALLITLGKERSAEVLRHLSDDDIERLTWEISAMGELQPEQRKEVIGEFQDAAVARNVISLAGSNSPRSCCGWRWAKTRRRSSSIVFRRRC